MLTQMQVAKICASAGAAIVPSHGRKDGKCTCGREDCQNPGATQTTTEG
jgi:hypothetical protein